MATFKFRLATLLRLREALRDERRAQLAEAYRVDELLQERLARVGGELGALREQCRQAAGPGTIDVDQLIEAQRYELSLRAHQRQLQKQREAVALEIDRRNEALVVANRDVRVLEKLRDKQSQHYREQQHRREIRQLDEVAQRQAAREEVA